MEAYLSMKTVSEEVVSEEVIEESIDEACDKKSMKEADKKPMKDDEEEKLDPVGKEDGDVDNDGDEDESDEYLKNRRKTISKSAKKDKEVQFVTKEDFDQLWAKIEEAMGKQTKGATEPEAIDSKESPKSKEFIDKHKGQSDKKYETMDDDGHDMAAKAAKSTKQAPNRGNDNLSNGDTKPVK